MSRRCALTVSTRGPNRPITNFLKDWLAKHIRETDKRYGPFLVSKGVK